MRQLSFLRRDANQILRAYPNNRLVTRPSEKFEAKAAGQKCSPGVVFSTLRTFFHRQRRHRALQPAAIERVIGIGSKYGEEYEVFKKAAILN